MSKHTAAVQQAAATAELILTVSGMAATAFEREEKREVLGPAGGQKPYSLLMPATISQSTSESSSVKVCSAISCSTWLGLRLGLGLGLGVRVRLGVRG